MKKKDIIVIVVLCILIAGGYFVYEMFQGEKDTVKVSYHKEVIETIDLSRDKIYTFKGDYGDFSLEVKDGKYHAIHVECPNHDCEKVGWVSKGSSKSIVCIPNQIYVVQTGSGDNAQ